AFAIEPEVTINNNWSNRYTMMEVTGLDRPGLLFELTATLSRLNLNIASAHVATFGERVVDVFYVTDLLGAKITAATRQAAIKRALIALFAPSDLAPSTRPASAAAGCKRALCQRSRFAGYPDSRWLPPTQNAGAPRAEQPAAAAQIERRSVGQPRSRARTRSLG